MNDVIKNVAEIAEGVEVKHFKVVLDADGNEVRVEYNPEDEATQDKEFSDNPAGN